MVKNNCVTICKKKIFNLYLMPHTKINSKCITGLNVRAKIIKLLEENTGNKFSDLGFGKGFFKYSQKLQTVKKINKQDLIKIKNYYSSEDIIKKMKIQATDWMEIFARHKSEKDSCPHYIRTLPGQ